MLVCAGFVNECLSLLCAKNRGDCNTTATRTLRFYSKIRLRKSQCKLLYHLVAKKKDGHHEAKLQHFIQVDKKHHMTQAHIWVVKRNEILQIEQLDCTVQLWKYRRNGLRRK